jgi:transcriptional regulator with XRE-family HTH domain
MRGKPGSAPGRYGYQPAFHVAWTRRISSAKLAEVTGYSSSMVRQVLRGWRRPSRTFVERTSQFLGLPPEALFNEEVRP